MRQQPTVVMVFTANANHSRFSMLRSRIRIGLALACLALMPALAHASSATTVAFSAYTPGTTTQINSTNVGSVVTLTATVTITGTGQDTAPGTVVFCDDAITGIVSGDYGICGVKAQLGRAQIEQTGTAAGVAFSAGKASINVRLPAGTHYLYVKFLGTPGAGTALSASTSFGGTASSTLANSNYPLNGGTSGYSVSGSGSSLPLASVMSATGNPGDYSLTNTLIAPTTTAPSSISTVVSDGATTLGTFTSGSYGSQGSTVQLSPAAIYNPFPVSGAYATLNAGSKTVVTADFNNDGIPALIVLGIGETTPGAELMLGSSTNPGTFSLGTPFTVPHSTGALATAVDVNNDGWPAAGLYNQQLRHLHLYQSRLHGEPLHSDLHSLDQQSADLFGYCFVQGFCSRRLQWRWHAGYRSEQCGHMYHVRYPGLYGQQQRVDAVV